MISELFAEKVREWADLHVPYVHRGMTRQGCDCTGLIIGCLQELGYLTNFKLRYYPKDWNLHAMADDYIQQELGIGAKKLLGTQVRIGDILLFRFGKCPAHCGVLISHGVFAHSHAKAGRVEYAVLKGNQWSKRWIATWRLSEEKLREQ
jgi:cell wall-associated NlpC family hydrolase